MKEEEEGKGVKEETGGRDQNVPERAPDEKHFTLQIRGVGVDHVRRGVGDGEVSRKIPSASGVACRWTENLKEEEYSQQPIRRRRHTQTLRPHFQRKQLPRDNPRHWAPTTREEINIHAHERNRGALRIEIRLRRDGAGDGHDELTHRHPHRPKEE